MSDGVCCTFQQHAWKTDTCANCLKSRSCHGIPSSAPTPAKRQSKEPSCTQYQTGSNELAGVKPSPIKAKPVIRVKPGIVPKTVNSTAASDPFVSNGTCSSAKEYGQNSEITEPLTVVSTSVSSGCDPDVSTVHSQPAVVELTKVKADAQSNDSEGTVRTSVPTSSKNSHYYQVYDVAARHNTADNQQVATFPRQSVNSRNPAMRVVDDDVLETQVAMPYNVVDVTIRRPKASDCLPQLPQTPAPSTANSHTTNTWPASRKPPAVDEDAVVDSSPPQREKVIKESTNTSSLVSKDNLLAKSSQQADALSNNDSSADRFAHRIYEDIDDNGKLSSVEIPSQTTVRGGSGKSVAFEAKMAALGSLDLGRVGKVVPPAGPNPSENPAANSECSELQLTDTSQNKTNAAVRADSPKLEKSRKTASGGKSFFHKLLRIGSSKDASKDASEEKVEEQTPSPKPVSQSTTEEITADLYEPCEGSTSQDVIESTPPPIASTSSRRVLPPVENQAVLMNLKERLAKRQTTASDSEEKVPLKSAEIISKDQPVPKEQQLMTKPETCAPVPKKSISTLSDSNPAAVMPAKFETNTAISPKPAPRSKIIVPGSADKVIESSRVACAPIQIQAPAQACEIGENLTCSNSNSDACGVLTVTTDTSMTSDCSLVSPGSSSDAISPTPSDPAIEDNLDRSARRRSKVDQKLSREVRRTLGAPPPPPPSSPLPSVDSSCPSLLPEVSSTDLQRSLLPLAATDPNECGHKSASDSRCHSLPRSKPSIVKGIDKETVSADSRSSTITASNSKHSRSKTMTEGIITANEHNHRKDSKPNDDTQQLHHADRRTSKYLNRALPDLPVDAANQKTPSVTTQRAPADNEYELVTGSTPVSSQPQLLPQSVNGTLFQTYEDIDELSRQEQNAAGSKPIVVDEEYLEPVLPAGEDSVAPNWRPLPAPRSCVQSASLPTVPPSQATYANVSGNVLPSPCGMPSSMADGLSTVDRICLEGLKRVKQKFFSSPLSSSVGKPFAPFSWSDFELYGDQQPILTQNHASFYQAKHHTLSPDGCILLVFSSIPEQPLPDKQHVNVIRALTTFHANKLLRHQRSSNDSSTLDIGNVMVLPYRSVMPFDAYWRLRHQSVTSGETPAVHLEREICHVLVQLLSAALHLNVCSKVTKPRLDLKHVVMATVRSDQWMPLVRPSVKVSSEIAGNSGVFHHDVSQLVTTMLQPDATDDVDSAVSESSASIENPSSKSAAAGTGSDLLSRLLEPNSELASESKYMRCLQRVVRCLSKNSSKLSWESSVMEARSLLEFVLWGPRENEAKLAAVSETRDVDLKVWLTTSRCRLLVELADRFLIEETKSASADVETINRVEFICSTSEMELLNVTKLLFV